MTTDYDMWKYLYGKAVDQGLTFDPRSGLKNNRRTCDLIRSVRAILKESGQDATDELIQAILELRIPNLVSSWTGVDTEAHRAIDKFFKLNPEGLNNDHGKGDYGGDEDDRDGKGQGDDQGDDQDQGKGQNGGEGEDDQHQNGGDGEGEDDDWDLDENDDGQNGGNGGKGGRGGWFNPKFDEDEDKKDQDQDQDQDDDEDDEDDDMNDDHRVGDGRGKGKHQDNHQEKKEEPPQPQDPNYIKPKIWNQFMKILMWNMEHPGKQKNIMLVGPRGIGKTEMVIQAAKALNAVYPEMCAVPYMITSPQMKHEVTGYGNATGEYVPTEFTKGYVAPGITLIEEMDRSEPTALIAMNAALANKIMDTPVQGMIEQNQFCNVVATANTAGIGATIMYNTANQLDASTRDRFVYLEMEFDEELALQIAKGDKHLVEFVKRWNTACELEGMVHYTCSYRALVDIKDLRNEMGFTVREALENVVLKAAVPKDNLRSILDKMKDISMNPYFSAMELIQIAMPDVEMC